jgi:hypothetical protein
MANAVEKAFDKVGSTFNDVAEPKFLPFDLGESADSPLTKAANTLEPASSFRKRAEAMVKVPDWLLPRTDIFEPLRAAPDFEAALASLLTTSNPDAFVPRDIVLPQNSVSALRTNARFEAAALVGANHEINGELIWRTYPTDGRATTMRRFWNWRDKDRDDIDAISTWPSQALLKDCLKSAAGNLVVAIRGSLLQRYPNTIIFAWKAAGEESLEPLPPDPAQRRTVIRESEFRQFVGPDLTLAGLDLTPEEFVQGWFLILQEPISESRFGLDEVGTTGGTGKNVNDRNWSETDKDPGAHLPAAFFGPDADSASIANILLQRPVRVAIHSSRLTPAMS